ncbi:hypothetical protein BP6252_07607 [Coleophoma cylindrospora]|uniref:Cytochrome P450 n=1 Tax=Coleophoma cylindrospora TaxID=1849047 RepID=A0A3D8RB03_9HELO|nr:hypothetical protein BP6252_07607 [Coleophoma cylindrospora]
MFATTIFGNMSSYLSTQPWILGLFLFIFTLCIVAWKRTNPPPGHPPLVKATIPWLGHSINMLMHNSWLMEHVEAQYPRDGIKALTLAGGYLYMVTDPELAAQTDRQPRSFSFDSLPMIVAAAFGCGKDDMKLIEHRAPDFALSPNSKMRSDRSEILDRVHRLTSENLQSKSLDCITEVFLETLTQRIDHLFPEGQDASYQWEEVELMDFVKEHWTVATTISLFGSKLYEAWPDLDRWIWEFDPNVDLLLTRLPFVFPKARRMREEGLEKMERWEADAMKADQEGLIPDGAEWTPYWGVNFMKTRAKILDEYGLSSRGKATFPLSLFWGQNTNTIPVSIWLFVQAFTIPGLSPRLLTAIQDSRSISDPRKFDISLLHGQPLLQSLLREAYRWATSSPSIRTLQIDAKIGPYVLLKGGLVMIHPRSFQMRPDIWSENAAQFDPERFLETDVTVPQAPGSDPNGGSSDTKAQKLRQLSVRAFGGGHHLCPGRHLAGNQIVGGCAVLMNMLEIEVVEDVLKERGLPKVMLADNKKGGLWPDRGLRVRMRRRR